MYSVWFRRVGLFSFWREIKNVVTDGVGVNGIPHRYFVDKDGHRYEIPFLLFQFSFDPKRQQLLAEQEAERQKAESKAEVQS